jgi:hypothetical protein
MRGSRNTRELAADHAREQQQPEQRERARVKRELRQEVQLCHEGLALVRHPQGQRSLSATESIVILRAVLGARGNRGFYCFGGVILPRWAQKFRRGR